MERDTIEKLKQWKDDTNKQPLIIQGARQVGKTWLMQEFGKRHYQKTAYFNFDSDKNLKEIFNEDFNIKRIVRALEIIAGFKFSLENTLIIFDEIQECPRALTSLKYFCENEIKYHIVAGGSLLGLIHLENSGFPVGKVSFLNLYPLNFFEFLKATNNTDLINLIKEKDFNLIKIFKNKYESLLKNYFFIGGMPEVVNDFIEHEDYNRVREIQNNILSSYEKDFSKHIPSNIVEKVRMLWRAIPSVLSKKNKKFIYSAIKEGARAKEYELALHWLKDAGLIYQIHSVKTPILPLIAYQNLNAFKLFIVDIGLLSAITNLDTRVILEKTTIFDEFKGALTEQFVCQELKSTFSGEMPIYYWTNETSRAEIDFILQVSNIIVPVEVKATTNLKAKSLNNFIDKFKPEKSIRTSLADYKINENNLFDIPLYAVSEFSNLIK